MQAKLVPMEEGKENFSTFRPSQCKTFPVRVLQCFFLFLILGLGASFISMYTIRHLSIQDVAPVIHSIPTIRSCTEQPPSIESWLKTTPTLLHTMTDTELLWRASFATRIKSYPFKRVTKVAFMFLTKGPLPMAPLWERFFKGHEKLYSIYIHSLPSYLPDFPSSSVFYKKQIPSQVTEWGEMSICDAERRLLANALLDISNEWFVLLSEACIPLQNFSIVYRYISKSRYSFTGSFDEDSPAGRGRYNKNMAPLVELSDWRKGSQWFEVNRELAIKIVEDTTYYPVFKEFCRPDCYVDEHYFQTMLTMKAPHFLANRSITYVDWSRPGAHPATFGKNDITEKFLTFILEQQSCLYNNQPTSLCYLFARKFAPSALEPLLNISSRALGI